VRAPGVSGVVLAGGEGRRAQGRDKGWIEVGGQPLVARAVAALAPQVGALALSVNRNLDSYGQLGHALLEDAPPPFRGPLAGIAAALVWCPTPWLATVPVDAPDAPRDWVAPLLAAARPDTTLLVLDDGARMQPLFALYRRELAAAARAALAAGELAVHRFQAAQRALVVAAALTMPIANLNSPP
jgi:molybdopterin-guanine dinucleotide biosynthesis protein A